MNKPLNIKSPESGVVLDHLGLPVGPHGINTMVPDGYGTETNPMIMMDEIKVYGQRTPNALDKLKGMLASGWDNMKNELKKIEPKKVISPEELKESAKTAKKMELTQFTPTNPRLLEDFSIKTKPLNQRSMLANSTANIGGAGGYKVYGS